MNPNEIFEKSLNEAIIGTNKGYVYYINLKDKKFYLTDTSQNESVKIRTVISFDSKV